MNTRDQWWSWLLVQIALLHKQQPADMGYIHDWVTPRIDWFEKHWHRADHTWRFYDNVLCINVHKQHNNAWWCVYSIYLACCFHHCLPLLIFCICRWWNVDKVVIVSYPCCISRQWIDRNHNQFHAVADHARSMVPDSLFALLTSLVS